MFNTHATTKIVFNAKSNTLRVLIAFNTNNVNTKNAVYISGDLLCYYQDSYNNANTICAAINNAFKTLRINKSNLQITNQAYSNKMCAISAQLVSEYCYNAFNDTYN